MPALPTTITTTASVHPSPLAVQPQQPARGAAVFTATHGDTAAGQGCEEQERVAVAKGLPATRPTTAARPSAGACGTDHGRTSATCSTSQGTAVLPGRQMSTTAAATVRRTDEEGGVNQQRQSPPQYHVSYEDMASIEFISSLVCISYQRTNEL